MSIPDLPSSSDTELIRRLHRQMLRIRRSEEKILELLLQNKLASTMCHVGIGQEAVAVGTCDVLAPQDYISSTHRGHGHYLARGGSELGLMAELLGRQAGACGGLGASMHLVAPEIGHLGSNAIVGGHIPIATGAALWARISGQPRVSVVFFGDGASTEGIFHEAVNFAAVERLPVVFVLENNRWAMSLPWERSTLEPTAARKAEAYGIAGVDVDGQDVIAVRAVAAEAVERARGGGGPTLIGAETYRFLGHSRADPSTYRDSAEEERWKARDPLVLARSRLLELDPAADAAIEQAEREIAEELRAAVEAAEASPPATLEDVTRGVYAAPLGGAR
ncbi:MAG TPA: thiamine pyrophosphate-dependent dehydrogenase E1 component subunit alpha [Candidatus Limnocylindria bacterium]